MKRILYAILTASLISTTLFCVQAQNSGFIKIEAERQRVIALKEDGTIWTWDRGTADFNIHRIDGLSDSTDIFTDIVANHIIALALKNDGTVWTWDTSTTDFNIRKVDGFGDIAGIFTADGFSQFTGYEAYVYGAIDKSGIIIKK